MTTRVYDVTMEGQSGQILLRLPLDSNMLFARRANLTLGRRTDRYGRCYRFAMRRNGLLDAGTTYLVDKEYLDIPDLPVLELLKVNLRVEDSIFRPVTQDAMSVVSVFPTAPYRGSIYRVPLLSQDTHITNPVDDMLAEWVLDANRAIVNDTCHFGWVGKTNDPKSFYPAEFGADQSFHSFSIEGKYEISPTPATAAVGVRVVVRSTYEQRAFRMGHPSRVDG